MLVKLEKDGGIFYNTFDQEKKTSLVNFADDHADSNARKLHMVCKMNPLEYVGCNIYTGDRCYINFDCCILDCGRVDIGNDVLIAPGVHVYCATHPIDPGKLFHLLTYEKTRSQKKDVHQC